MSRAFGKLTGLAVVCLVLGSTVLMNTCHALTNPPASSGSVIISAIIAPVRYILVDDHYRITKILSNSQADVTPLVYKNNFNARPIALSQAIYNQYTTLMKNINPNHTGIIYRRNNTAVKPFSVIAELVRLSSYQSILFRAPM